MITRVFQPHSPTVLPNPLFTMQNLHFLIGAVSLTLLLDIFFYVGFFAATDDGSYLGSAFHFANLHTDFTYQFNQVFTPDGKYAFDFAGLRFISTIPSALLYKLSGGSIHVISAYFIAYHIGITIMSFVVGSFCFDHRTGRVASFLAATTPLLFMFAGSLLPDTTLSFWTLCLVFGLVYFYRYRGEFRLSVNNRKRIGLLFTAGICLGLAYSAKQFGLVLVVPAALAIALSSRQFFSKETIVNGAIFGSGLFLVFLFETTLLYILFDEIVTRKSITFVKESIDLYTYKMGIQGTLPKDRMQTLQELLTMFMPQFMLTIYSVSILNPGVWKKQNRIILIFLAWIFIYLTFGSVSLTQYLTPPIQPRYYAVVFTLANLLLAKLIVDAACMTMELIPLKKGSLAKQAGIALISSAIILCITTSNIIQNWRNCDTIYDVNFVNSFRNAYEDIKIRYPDHPVVLSDYLSKQVGPLFSSDENPPILIDQTTDMKLHFPYIYLAQLRLMESGRPLDFAMPGFIPQDIRIAHVYYPSATKTQQLTSWFNKLIGKDGVDTIDYGKVPLAGATLAVLAYQADDAAYRDPNKPAFTTQKHALPLLLREEGSLATLSYEGNIPVISWPANHSGRPIRIYCFDKDWSLTPIPSRPRNFFSYIGESTKPVEATIKIENLSSDSEPLKVKMDLYTYIYKNGELAAMDSATPTISGDTTIRLLAASKAKARKFRVEFTIFPRINQAGKIRINELTIRRL